MKIQHTVVAAFAAVVVSFSSFALEISGEYPVNVESGTQEISELISGDGYILKTGAGTLILSNSGNTFTGGVKISAGVLSLTATGAAGNGDIDISGSGYVSFDAAGTFANKINVAADATASYKVEFTKQVTLTGAITSAANLAFLNKTKVKCTVDATVDATGKNVSAYGTDHWVITDFLRKVTCEKVVQTSGWPDGIGIGQYSSTDNDFNGIQIAYSCFRCGAAGCIPEKAIIEWTGTNAEGSRASLLFYGLDQTASSLKSPKRTDNKGFSVGSTAISDQAATLTLKANESNSADCSIDNAISLVYDPKDDAYVQQLNNRTHATTGGFTVKGGTLQFNGATTIARAKFVRVEGGTFDFNTSASASMVALEELAVASGATFKLSAAGAETAFRTDYGLTLKLASDGSFDVPAGLTVYVKELWIDGVKRSAGTYGHAQCAAIPEGVSVIAASRIITESGDIEIGELPPGDSILIVNAGVTVTNVTVITGTGRLVKTGEGTLVLTNANEYTGGTLVQSGTLRVTASDAFGQEEVRVTCGAVHVCRLVFEPVSSVPLVLPNAFVFEKLSSSTYPAALMDFTRKTTGMDFMVTFNGSITALDDLYLYNTSVENMNWNDTRHVTFDCPVDVSGHTLTCESRCGIDWKGKVTAARYQCTSSYPNTGYHFFYSSENEIGEAYFDYQNLMAGAANVFPGTRILFGKHTEAQRGSFKLQGFDQTVSYVLNESNTGKYVNYNDYSAATLTVTGGVANAKCVSALGYGTGKVKLSVTVDADDASFVQDFCGRSNVTYGVMKALRGTLRFSDAALIRNVPEIVVGSGTFDLATTLADAASGVTNVTVGAGGTFRFAETATTPFGGDATAAEMRLASDATLEIPTGETVIVRQLFVDGKRMPKGLFTANGGSGTEALANISGGGTLKTVKGTLGMLLILK